MFYAESVDIYKYNLPVCERQIPRGKNIKKVTDKISIIIEI